MFTQRVLPIVLAIVGLLGLALASERAHALLPEPVAGQSTLSIPDLPGHQAGWRYEYRDLVIPRQDLLFTNFQRPGKAADIYDGKGRYNARFFNYRSDNAPPLDQTVGGPVETNYGGIIRYAGFDNITVDAGYVGGKLQWSEDELVFNPRPEQRADSWNLATTSHWWDRTLSTRFEYARSLLRPQVYDNRDVTQEGRALEAEMRLASGSVLGAGWFDRWVGTLRYRAVDPEYYTIGNTELTKGTNSAQLLLQSEFHGLGMTLDWLREGHCPREGCAGFDPTLNRTGLLLHYELTKLTLPLFGTPIVGARYYQVDSWQPDEAVQRQGYSAMQNHEETGVNLLFRKRFWYWSLDYQVSDQDHWREYTDPRRASRWQPSDWRHETTLFDLGWEFGQRMRLNLQARRHEQIELDPDYRFQYHNVGVNAYLGRVLGRMSVDMGYYFGREANNLDTPFMDTQYRSQSGSTQLTWQFDSLRGERAAVDVYVRSSFYQYHDVYRDEKDLQWSASVGFQLVWGEH